MADSKDNNNSSDDFADDLDAMLNDVGSLSDIQDELIDNEDAIDRLLMDDSPDVSEKETAEIQVDEFAEIDEFGDENEPVTARLEEETLTQSTDATDEFVEDNIKAEAESDDDFLMADFNISVDDDESSDPDNDELKGNSVSSDIDEFDANSQLEENFDTDVAQQEFKKANPSPSQTVTESESKQSNVIFDELNAQINQLWADNENLKQQIAKLSDSSNQDNSVAEELESLQNEQRKLRKSFKENEGKAPVVTFVALGIAFLALLVAGGLGAIAYGAQSGVTDLTELISTLEEEIEILNAKDSSAKINKINEQISLLTAKDDDINKQLNEAKKALQSSNLKPVVDDLVEQNDHAQVAIEQLLAKVETLEKRKFISSRSKKPKKTLVKDTWVVNLVSFKQEWYAKRKATEFEKKGIPAEIIKVEVKGENWFRLRVKGFKSKYEAASYAVKVKKTLNLSSVWVTKI